MEKIFDFEIFILKYNFETKRTKRHRDQVIDIVVKMSQLDAWNNNKFLTCLSPTIQFNYASRRALLPSYRKKPGKNASDSVEKLPKRPQKRERKSAFFKIMNFLRKNLVHLHESPASFKKTCKNASTSYEKPLKSLRKPLKRGEEWFL